MQAEELDQGDIGAGLNLINSVFSNWIQLAMRKTLEEAGILGQGNNSKDEEEDKENSIGANSARWENHTNKD